MRALDNKLWTAMAIMALGAAPVAAQEVPDPALIARLQAQYAGENPAFCVISSSGDLPLADSGSREGDALSDPEPVTVFAGCGDQGLILGRADSYEVAAYEASQATVVVMILDGEPRVWLLSPTADGAVVREDLTATMARSAGRGVMSGLRDMAIDIESFSQDGRIALQPVVREGARPAQAAEFNADALVTQERERSADADRSAGQSEPSSNEGAG